MSLQRSDQSEDVYKLRIGCIPARTPIKVEVGFCLPLSPDFTAPGTSRLVLPTALLHRYVPSSMTSSSDAGEAVAAAVDDVITRLKAGTEQAGLTLEMRINGHSPLVSVSSPSHASISDTYIADMAEGGTTAAFHARVPASVWVNPLRFTDFHLNICRRAEFVPYVFIERPTAVADAAVTADAITAAVAGGADSSAPLANDAASAAALATAYKSASAAALVLPGESISKMVDALLPAHKSPDVNVVFIIDRSGSMGGRRIEQARSALQLALRSLPSERTRFNIVSFGSSYRSMFDSCVPLDQARLIAAASEVGSMEADMGGTEVSNVYDRLSSFCHHRTMRCD